MIQGVGRTNLFSDNITNVSTSLQEKRHEHNIKAKRLLTRAAGGGGGGGKKNNLITTPDHY